MNTQMEMEERLWDYIDGLGTEAERATIDRLVKEQASWREKYRELLDVHQLMASSELEEPSMRFTKNVMDEIGRLHIQPAASTYINKRIIFGIMAFFMSILLGFLVYGFGQMEWTTDHSLNIAVTLPEFELSKFIDNSYVNAFMILNLIVGLLLFDRYLSSKRPKRLRHFRQ